MSEYDINEVLEYAEDLKKELRSKSDIDEFNQSIMRLSDAISKLHVIDNFEEIKD